MKPSPKKNVKTKAVLTKAHSEKLLAIKRQAELLAADNLEANPSIEAIYWFPDEEEIRLIEVEANMIPSHSGSLEPFYFAPALRENLPSPIGLAVIRPEEVGTLTLPDEWGDWTMAIPLEIGR